MNLSLLEECGDEGAAAGGAGGGEVKGCDCSATAAAAICHLLASISFFLRLKYPRGLRHRFSHPTSSSSSSSSLPPHPHSIQKRKSIRIRTFSIETKDRHFPGLRHFEKKSSLLLLLLLLLFSPLQNNYHKITRNNFSSFNQPFKQFRLLFFFFFFSSFFLNII